MRFVEFLKRAIPIPEQSNILTPPVGDFVSTKRNVIVRLETGGNPTGRAAALRLQDRLEEAAFTSGDLAKDQYDGDVLVLTFSGADAAKLEAALRAAGASDVTVAP